MIRAKVPARYKTALGKDMDTAPAGGGMSWIEIPDEYVPLMGAARRADSVYHAIDEVVTLAHMYEITLPPEFEEALQVFSDVYITVAQALEQHEEEESRRIADEGGEREDND